MKKFLFFLALTTGVVVAQQTINDLTVKDLKVVSTSKGSKPCPLMTGAQISALVSPLNGQCAYNTTTNKLNVYNGSLWKAAGGGVDSWLTSTVYSVDDLVIQSDKIYQCLTGHTSGVFATDLAALKWKEISKTDLASATGTLPIANGGTGSATQNFVDLSSVQNSIAGAKTFTSQLTAPSLVSNGTAGAGYLSLLGQSSQPAAPAAGTVLLHGITNNGFTRLEHNSEALNPLVLGQDNIFVAKNVSGAPITIGQVVYVNGSTGAVPNVTLARSNAGTTIKSTIGIATESSVADNSFGQFMTGGILDSVNTNAFNAGDILYVDPTTPGALTSTKPAYPNYNKEVGIVLNKGVGNGSILVNISSHTGGSETGTDYATFTAAQLVSNVTTGTPPLVVSSTTPVANLSIGGNAATATSLSSTLTIGAGGTGQTTKAAAFDALSPMTTAGDTIIGGASGTGTRLAVGKETNVKRVVGGTVAWAEEDRSNLLVNPNFEDSALTGWTCTTGTCTSTAVSGEFSEGLLGYKITTGSPTALSISQSVATLSGSTTQYVVGISYRVPATITDFQICTLIAGSEKTCVPSANLIADGAFHTIEIPEVITPGSTVGIKAKTTATYSANVVYLDKAYIKQGIGTQALQLDNVYSAQVSATAVISGANKTGWLSGCSVTSPSEITCTYASGINTLPMNCTVSHTTNGAAYYINVNTSTASGFSYRTITSAIGAVNSSASVVCQKSGNDYLAASSAAYSQASANYDWTSYSPAITGLGTISSPSSNYCKHRRQGGDLEITCSLTTGTATATLFTLPLPNSLTIDSSRLVLNNTTASVGQVVGTFAANASGQYGSILANTGTSSSQLYWSNIIANTVPLIPVNGNSPLSNNTALSIYAKIPISGWSNSSTIVGSFAGVPAVPGALTVQDIYTTVTGGGTNGSCTGTCTPVNMKGFSTPTRNSAGNYTNTFSTAFTVAPICHVTTSALNASNAIGCCRVSTTTTAASVVCNMCTTGGAEDVAYHLRCVGDK